MSSRLHRSRNLLAAAVSLIAGVGLAAYLVIGNHPWDSDEAMPIGVGEGIHPTDLFAVVPLLLGIAAAGWFVWRSRRHDPADPSAESSPGVPAPPRR